jgi:hypothetical protein
VIAVISCVAALILLFTMTMFKKHPPLLEWTAERDEYDTYRKTRKQKEAEVEDDGGSDGRSGAGEEDKERD